MCGCRCCRQIVRVSVIERGGAYFVQPPIAYLEAGAEFRLFNRTRVPLRVPSLFPGPGRGGMRVVPGGDSLRQVVPCTAPDRHFSYKVQMMSGKTANGARTWNGGKYAQGNSDPVIVIDNP